MAEIDEVKEPPVENSGTPGKSEAKKFDCPRCGWSTEGVPKAPEADLQEYLRCVMGGNRFTKTYLLYNGAMKLTFSTLTMDEADRLNMVIMQNKFEDNDELSDVARKTKLMFCLRTIKLQGDTVVHTPPQAVTVVPESKPEDKPVFDWSKETMGALFKERFGRMDETMLRTIYRTYALFDGLSRLLVSDGFDENFWKGAGPY